MSATLEERVARDDYMQYKHICDIITKFVFPASNRNVTAGVACTPIFVMDPILRDFILDFIFFHLVVSWVDVDDLTLAVTLKMECL